MVKVKGIQSPKSHQVYQINYVTLLWYSLVPRLGRPNRMYTSNTCNKSGDDCNELDADWMTVCHLFLETYDTHMPYSEAE